MNFTLLKSPHAIIALLICVGFAAWPKLIGASYGPVSGGDVTYLLWSGWIAYGLMVVACLYVLRKYMHKLGWSPEFKMKVPVGVLERTDSRLTDLRHRIEQGALDDRKEIEALAKNILREERVHKVIQCEVRATGAKGSEDFEVIVGPTEPFGRMLSWLHAHTYYGLASGALVWWHGGMKFDEPMGIALNALTIIVIVTGIIGLYLFAVGPSWLKRGEQDVSFEQQFVLTASLEEKFDEVAAKLEEEPELLSHVKAAAKAKSKPDQAIRKELSAAVAAKPDAKALLQDVMVLLGQRRRIEVGLSRLMRVRFVMNIWRAVHVPVSIALMVLVFVHIMQVWWY